MPAIEVERPRTLCPAGLYTFKLAEIKTVQMDAFNPEDGKVNRWVWRFVSNRINPEDGCQFEIGVVTGMQYGNGRAKLTWLLDMLVPGFTKAQAATFDTDSLIGKTFDGSVKHAQSQKDPDKKIAEIQYLRPITDTSAPTAEPDPFEFDDKPETPENIQAAFAAAQAEIASLKAREGKHGIGA